MCRHGLCVRGGGLLVSAAIVLACCTAAYSINVPQTEQMLEQAGFQKRVADTPAKLTHLRQLTPLQLVAHTKDDKTYFVFADPDGCQCLFIGDPWAYQRYQQLALDAKQKEEETLTWVMNQGASMDWGAWGPPI
jgi:hypothetical protein